LKPSQYQQLLGDIDIELLEAPARCSEAPARKRFRNNDEVQGDDDDDDGVQGDSDAERQVSDGVHGDSDDAKSPSSSGSSSSSSNTGGSVTGGSDDESYPKRLNGMRLRTETHRHGGDPGLRTSCPTHGSKCRKFRGLENDVPTFGHFGPVYYLGAWQLKGTDLPMAEHGRWSPHIGGYSRIHRESCMKGKQN
jgi:hypothetical protein